MRTATITDLQGNQLGQIIEEDNGSLRGEGKGESLVEQTPTRTFDEWLSFTRHSKYLRLTEQD